MARKRSATTNGAQKPANKTEAVELALAAGVTSPIEIAAYAKEHYGLDITPAHVSTIKGNLKKAKKGKKKPVRKPAPVPQSAPKITKPTPKGEAGLTTKDLASLIDMARRVGGYDALQEYVEILKR